MKSFGFIPPKKDQPRIPISSLSKEKIRKLTNLRVIQKTLVYFMKREFQNYRCKMIFLFYFLLILFIYFIN